MKKAKLLFVILAILACNAFAANFAPTPMKLSAAQQIRYDFDGKDLEIPLTVSGAGGTGIFSVYTKDQGEKIGVVQNGFLGWHYVNKIDTSVYISSPLEINVGTNTIRWSGRDSDGGLAPAGDYTYYIWCYDSRNQKQFVSQKIGTVMHNEGNQVHIAEFDEKGQPLANPFMYFTPAGSGTAYKAKWVIGNDPADSSLVETCRVPLPASHSIGRICIPVPDDYTKIFASGGISRTVGIGIGTWKVKWVPNGVGEMDLGWADNGYASWDKKLAHGTVPASDGTYLYRLNCQTSDKTNAEAGVGVFDLDDGSFIKSFDLTDWWSDQGDADAGGYLNGGPNGMNIKNGRMFLGSHASCVVQMVNPLVENDDEFILWTNQNGDTIMDHNFDPSVSMKWVCNDLTTPPFTTSFEVDSNSHMAAAIYGLGAVSFGLIGPDGTGIGYFSFAGDSDSRKFYINFVDHDSPFDGMYMDNQASVGLQDNPNGAKLYPGIMYIAHDSIKGMIGTQIGVKDSAPAAFTVAQNAPNPFNPSTTISFTLAKAGKTTVEVFNAAGQKVDTILNANLNAGSHSATWNAARHSAGVYFYTVKNGGITKTMKMTLLK
ncbi:MAG: T9SS type A sorting domain-containing protein [Candidatus Latescibacterota bacterium]